MNRRERCWNDRDASMRSKSGTAAEVNVCSQGKQQRFWSEEEGRFFLSKWMSRLEVVVGWDWAGAIGGGGHALFSKGPTPGRPLPPLVRTGQ